MSFLTLDLSLYSVFHLTQDMSEDTFSENWAASG